MRHEDVHGVLDGAKDVFRLVVAFPEFHGHEPLHVGLPPYSQKHCDVLGSGDRWIGRVSVPYRGGELVYLSEEWTLIDGSVTFRSDYELSSNGSNLKRIWARPGWMPPKLSRQWLRIASIRAERLQEITVEDVMREGVWHPPAMKTEVVDLDFLRNRFARTWNATHDERSRWELNPFVWRIETSHITPERRHEHG